MEPNPTALTRLDCEKYGLALFEGTIQQFIDFIDAEFPDRPLPIELVPRTVRDLFSEATPERTILKFSLDFEVVPAVAHANTATSRFLYGAPPTWDDLASGIDVGRAITTDLVEACVERLSAEDDAGRILVLMETPGSGKTTVIRRAAFELTLRGIKVISCVPFSGLEPNFTANTIDQIDGPLVIVVDNLADQVSVIVDVLALVKKKDLVTLCAERSYRGTYISRTFSGLPFIPVDGLRLTRQEAAQLIERYRSRGLLGAEQAIWDAAAFARDLESDSIAVGCCRILKDFRPLDRIVESIENAATDVELKRYRVAALAQHCIRGGVRYEVLAGIAGLDGWDEQFRVEHPTPLAYVDNVSNFVVPMSSIVAALILRRTNVDQLLAVFVDLGIAIASRVNSNAVRARTAEARLAGRLFDYDQIVEGFLGDRADDLYEQIKPYWEWNSRYWIQVALRNLSSYFAKPNSEGGRDALQRARQFARHAVLIEHHPMSLTTLAKVLFAQMQADGVAHRGTFDEAFGRVAEAIYMERRRFRLSAQPLVTLFRGVREFVFTLGGQLTEAQRTDLLGFVDEALNRIGRDAEVQAAIGGIVRLLPPRMRNTQT